MNIVVLGSTGGIGRQVVDQALAAGHCVTAVVRKPVQSSDTPRLRVLQADVRNPEALKPLVASADAVVSTLGHRRGDVTTIQGDGAAALVAAAPEGTRVLFTGASAMYSDSGDGPFVRWLAKPMLRWFLRRSYADTARMEQIAERSALGWTIVRPSRLTDGERTGSFRSSVDRNLRGGMTISRADVAAAMLALLEDSSTVRHAVYVAY
jgi:putative NADH-flavin reductase